MAHTHTYKGALCVLFKVVVTGLFTPKVQRKPILKRFECLVNSFLYFVHPLTFTHHQVFPRHSAKCIKLQHSRHEIPAARNRMQQISLLHWEVNWESTLHQYA